MKQSSIDLNCRVGDFIQDKNRVVISKLNPGRKKYFKERHFCQCAFYGGSLVASVDKSIEEFMVSFVSRNTAFRCFDMPQLNLLNAEFSKYDKCVGMISEYYLPDMNMSRDVNSDFDVKILLEDEVSTLYNDIRFPMALGYDCESERRDVIAVAAYRDRKIMGVAGASNDSDTMWQVGIDVIPEYRGKGVASVLTSIITEEILMRGIVPFYGTAWSNIASKNTAIDCGYKSAWVELAAVSTDF